MRRAETIVTPDGFNPFESIYHKYRVGPIQTNMAFLVLSKGTGSTFSKLNRISSEIRSAAWIANGIASAALLLKRTITGQYHRTQHPRRQGIHSQW
jgi:hypothetical protein